MRRFFIAGILAVALATSMQAQERTHILDPKLDSLFPDQPTSYLTDVTGKVTNPDIVNARLRDIREKDSLSLVAVVLPTTGDRAVEDVAREIGRKWLVAQKAEIGNVERNTGGVILLVLDSHKCRVEVATGSEGYMTDGRAADACRDARDNFRAGDFGGGIISIANEFDAAHKGETAVAADVKPTEPAPSTPFPWGIWLTVMGVVVAIGSGLVIWSNKEEEKRLAEAARLRAIRDAEYEEERRKQEETRLKREREAAAREAARWNALTPEQRAVEIAAQREAARLAAIAAAEATERRRKREAEEEEERRNRRASYSSSSDYGSSSSSSSYDSGSSSSSWSSGGSDSFSGGGGGSDW